MNEKWNVGFVVFLGGLLLCVVGCSSGSDSDDSTLDTKFTDTTTQPVSGKNLKVVFFTSGKGYVGDRESEVRPKLETMVNGGQYNINSVKTSYQHGKLVAAEVWHDNSGSGLGNNVRILLITSDKGYVGDREREVKPKFEGIVNSGKYNVVKTQSIYQHGKLVAAEVYYLDK